MEFDSFLNSHDPENTSLFRYMHSWGLEQDQSDPVLSVPQTEPVKAAAPQPEPKAAAPQTEAQKPPQTNPKEIKKRSGGRRESIISHSNAQKSYSIFEDAEILKRLNNGKQGRGHARFTNLKTLAPQFGRSLMGIQNRSRLLAKLVDDDKAYLLEYALTRPEEAKANFFIWRRSERENGEQQVEVSGIQTFTTNSSPLKAPHKQRGSKDKRVVPCEEIKTLLMTGAINEDDYFSDSSELSWVKRRRRKGTNSDNPAVDAEGLSQKASIFRKLTDDRQRVLDEELIFLKDLIFYLVNKSKMTVDSILEVARQKHPNAPELAELVQKAIKERSRHLRNSDH